MGLAVVALALSVVGSAPSTESVRYAAFKLERNGTRTVIAEGTREYSPETAIQSSNVGGNCSRRLLLFDAFELEFRFERGHPLDGFGLVINKRKSMGSFSFNWFERDQGDIFVKTRPRHSGRVKLTVVKAGRFTEPTTVEFLDDITLRFTDDMRNHPDDHTHEFRNEFEAGSRYYSATLLASLRAPWPATQKSTNAATTARFVGW